MPSKITMWNLMVHWADQRHQLVVVAYLIPGIHVDGLGPALIAPLVIGLVNATVGLSSRSSPSRSRFCHWEYSYWSSTP